MLIANRSTRTIHEMDRIQDTPHAGRSTHLRPVDPRDLDTLQTDHGYDLCGQCFRLPKKQQASPPLTPVPTHSDPTIDRDTEFLERTTED